MEQKSLWQSYIAGITDRTTGERYVTLFKFFLPELVTAFLSMSLLNIIDACFIGHLSSTSMYATQGVALKVIHMLMKIAEALSIGTLVLAGNYNGLQQPKNVGRAAITALWVAIFVGTCLASMLFFGGHLIFAWLRVPEKMIALGVPFLKVRAIGVFFAFIYFALIGFLRGIKKPGLSMKFFLLGGLVFVFFDYALIFGKFGLPQMGLQGSALASVIQYAVMLGAAVIYFMVDPTCKQYGFNIFTSFDKTMVRDIWRLSWPVVLDKTALTFAKLWLVRLIAPMGKMVIAGFNVICDMEQFAFVPALALAQVITFLVSNDYGIRNWLAIKNNTKKVLFLSSIMVLSILVIFSLFPVTVIHLVDRRGLFTHFAALAFPLLSTLVVFDVLQLILAGALRGASNVKTVMATRMLVTLFFFVPMSYCFAHAPIANPVIKFVLVFGAYYISNGVMSIVFVYRFRHDAWKYQVLHKPVKDIHDQVDLPRDRIPSKDVSHQDQAR